MSEVLRVGGVKLSDKGIGSAERRVDPLARQTGMTRQAVIDTLIEGFRRRFGLLDDEVTQSEWDRVGERITGKFATPEWTHRVP